MAARAIPLALILLAAQLSCGDDDTGTTPPVSFSRTDALMACVAANACGVLNYGYAGSYCLSSGWDRSLSTTMAPIWADIYECVLQAVPDCAQVELCFGQGQPLQGCSEVTDGYCDGDVQVSCAVDTFIRLDCARANMTCVMTNVTTSDVVPKCGKGACVEGQDTGACQGSLLLTCGGGNWEVKSCGLEGLTCGDGPTGAKECIGPGAPCADDTEPTCQGDVLRDCVGRHLRELDCTTLPGSHVCSPTDGACVPASSDCIPGDPEQCQGRSIRICVDGAWMTLDCGELGFSSCQVVPGSSSAHCVP